MKLSCMMPDCCSRAASTEFSSRVLYIFLPPCPASSRRAGETSRATAMPALGAIAEVCKGVGCVLAREAALPQAFVHVSAFAGIAGMLSTNILAPRSVGAVDLGRWDAASHPAASSQLDALGLRPPGVH